MLTCPVVLGSFFQMSPPSQCVIQYPCPLQASIPVTPVLAELAYFSSSSAETINETQFHVINEYQGPMI